MLNDDTLAPQHSISFIVEQNSHIIILPIVGTVEYKLNNAQSNIVTAGTLLILNATANTSIAYKNPLNNELINFVQIWIKADTVDNKAVHSLYDFNLDEQKNKLIPIMGTYQSNDGLPVISIGKFDGRQDTEFTLQNDSLFTFIIQGVFEVEDRLLHARDGLGLNNSNKAIELEALSNDAIILMIEQRI